MGRKRTRIEYCPGCLVSQPKLASYPCGSQRCPPTALITPENLALKVKQRADDKARLQAVFDRARPPKQYGKDDEQLLFCASCHELLAKSKLLWGPDPFKVWSCQKCHDESCGDI